MFKLAQYCLSKCIKHHSLIGWIPYTSRIQLEQAGCIIMSTIHLMTNNLCKLVALLYQLSIWWHITWWKSSWEMTTRRLFTKPGNFLKLVWKVFYFWASAEYWRVSNNRYIINFFPRFYVLKSNSRQYLMSYNIRTCAGKFKIS